MHLVLVISSLKRGGAERVATTLANAWVGRGEAVTIVTLDEEEKKPVFQLASDVRLLHISKGRGPLDMLMLIWQLRQQLITLKPSYVISFLYKINVITLLSAIGLKTPVVVAEHNYPGNISVTAAWRFWRAYTYPWSHRLITLTQRALEYFPKELQSNGCVIENPLAPEFFDCQWLGSKGEIRQLVAMGSLSKQKGFDLLLRAFAKVTTTHKEWKLTIWGEGDCRSELEELRGELALGEQVELPGMTEDSAAVFMASDLFVSSSRWEGFPCTIQEAMACQLPVVAFDCPTGPRELIKDGNNGFLVPNGKVDELASTLSRLMEDEDTRRTIGRAASSASKPFEVSEILKKWDDLVFQKKELSQTFHFYWSGQSFSYVNYLAVKSVVSLHENSRVIVHFEEEPIDNEYWQRLTQLENVNLCPLNFQELIAKSGYEGEDFSAFENGAAVNHRSDLIRYLLLLAFGGVYLDLDTLLLKPMTDLFDSDFFLAFQYYGRGTHFLNGAVLGGKASSLKLRRIVGELLTLSKTEQDYPWAIFGPALLTNLFLPRGFFATFIHYLLSLLERLGLGNSFLADCLVKVMAAGKDYEIYPRSYFYSVTCFSNEWPMLFKEGEAHQGAYLLHLWSNNSKDVTEKIDEVFVQNIDCLYSRAAQKFL